MFAFRNVLLLSWHVTNDSQPPTLPLFHPSHLLLNKIKERKVKVGECNKQMPQLLLLYTNLQV